MDEKVPRIQLGGEEARQFSLKCRKCGRRNVVYFISFPLYSGVAEFPAGAYCYLCLLKYCRATRMIPFPIDAYLLDDLKRDMGLKPNTPAKYIIRGGQNAKLHL
jgi:hypothetical protein